MNEKGFITSALLYGTLSLFFVLILGSLSIISNRKLASDRLKESALIDVENLTTDENCFEFDNDNSNCNIIDYNIECGNTVFIDRNEIHNCNLIGITSLTGVTDGYIYIKSYINIAPNAFAGNDNVTFITVGFEPTIDNSETIWGATNSYLKSY